MDPNRRDNPRLKIRVPVEIFIPNSSFPLRGATSDLSLSGCYIDTIFPIPIGTDLELKLQINGTLLILGAIATSDPQVGNGIHFTKMLPEDMDELRAFLEKAEKETAEKEKAEKEKAEKEKAE
jgi:hypothetical protein